MEQLNQGRIVQNRRFYSSPPPLDRPSAPKYEELKRNEEQKAADLQQNFCQKHIQSVPAQRSTSELLEELLELRKRNDLYESVILKLDISTPKQ